jgi:uncharacterized protein (TIGR00106 family)
LVATPVAAMLKVGDLRRHHRPLAFVKMPARCRRDHRRWNHLREQAAKCYLLRELVTRSAKTMVLLEFSMYPVHEGESLSAYVARSLDIIDKSGLPYQLTPMGTIIEGEWSDVMAVVTACFEAMRIDCNRIETSIKIDYRSGPGGRLTAKIKSVEAKLGRNLST